MSRIPTPRPYRRIVTPYAVDWRARASEVGNFLGEYVLTPTIGIVAFALLLLCC